MWSKRIDVVAIDSSNYEMWKIPKYQHLNANTDMMQYLIEIKENFRGTIFVPCFRFPLNDTNGTYNKLHNTSHTRLRESRNQQNHIKYVARITSHGGLLVCAACLCSYRIHFTYAYNTCLCSIIFAQTARLNEANKMDEPFKKGSKRISDKNMVHRWCVQWLYSIKPLFFLFQHNFESLFYVCIDLLGKRRRLGYGFRLKYRLLTSMLPNERWKLDEIY